LVKRRQHSHDHPTANRNGIVAESDVISWANSAKTAALFFAVQGVFKYIYK
jgi:hypothetical protein